ncbi:hypothetical protein HMPREF0673_01729 [Leyella stercorea DSM 18206]|uniref:Uncharacterized protein n=1 Tax=Leyella stercorea DSM 18206 TaxID=1002367 RepID=G6AYL8_9BACT|nr:hypothetical protein HMPREF0673_01729 [Leyella stercorea DSM 18206]
MVPIVRQMADKNSSRLVFIRLCWFLLLLLMLFCRQMYKIYS